MNTNHVRRIGLVLGVLLLCGLGAWMSGQLVKQHAGLWQDYAPGTGLFARLCQATGEVGLGCGKVADNRWAQIAIPLPVPGRDLSISKHVTVVPVAFFGLAYFVFHGLWFTFVGGPRPGRGPWQVLPVIAGGAGAVFSVVYLAIMATGLAPGCLWCTLVHGVNFLMLVGIWRLYRQQRAEPEERSAPVYSWSRPERRALSFREAATVVSFALIVVLGLWLYRREHLAYHRQIEGLLPYRTLVTSLRSDDAFLLREYYAQPVVDLPVRSDEGAEVGARLVVFTDYQCPSCLCADRMIWDRYVELFEGQLTVTVRHLPLSTECNSDVSHDLHPQACEAAYAAQAARIQGGDEAFEAMHRMLFANRDQLGAELYRTLAERIGLDGGQLLDDMTDPDVRANVADDIELARSLGVSATPTLFLNGRRITELLRESPLFWRAIAQSLQSETPLTTEQFASVESGWGESNDAR